MRISARNLAPIAVVLAGGVVALAGCAGLNASGATAPSGAVSTTLSSTNPPADTCYITDLTGIEKRMQTGALPSIADAALPAELSPYIQKGDDDKSFVTKVTAADLTSAGIDTSDLAQSTPLILIVNHGDWKPGELPVGQGQGIGGGSSSNDSAASTSAPAPADDNWLLYVVDPTDNHLVLFSVAPDYACFKG